MFVVCSVVAVVAGGAVVASVGSGGLAGSPVDNVLPGEEIPAEEASNERGFGDSGFDGQGFGSLSPGGQTGAGGEVQLDNGTFASTDTEIHFTAQSSQPTYWRTAAYDSYTGTGWERNTETEPYDPPLESNGFERVGYNITLNRSATALPVPWQPTTVSGLNSGSLQVSAEGGIGSDSRLSAGTTFTGVSDKPPSTPGLLREANGSQPPGFDRYTELPSDVPPRLATQTGNIVAGADSRYETAKAVERWLRQEKAYSLEAYRDSDQVADTFVFEMEAGYCEYFATAMATMLRTQDIPTRYAVGYSSGQYVGNDTYQVRGMNAHAWVEVYFPEVGWVQFDPTPGSARLDTQEDALAAVDEEYNVTDPASPGEQFDLDEDENESDTRPGWSVELNRTAVPGVAVEVTVTEDNEERSNVRVDFNSQTIGRTDSEGTVTGTVPDADTFDIALYPLEVVNGTDTFNIAPYPLGAENVTPIPEPDGSDDTTNDEGSAGLLRGGGAVSGTLGGGGVLAQPARVNETDEPVYNETVEVTTEVRLEISGEVVPGNEVGVTALVGGEPLVDAAVRLDGEVRGRTDEAGWVTFGLPSSPGSTTLAVEQGRFTGERSLDLPPLEVTVERGWPLAVPLAPATVEATYGDEPAVGVPVAVNGETVGTTGTDGKVSLRLPLAGSGDITITQYGVTAGTTVSGLLVTAALAAGAVFLVPGVVYLAVRRRSQSGSVRDSIRSRVGRLRGMPVRVLVTGVGRGDSVFGAVADWVRDGFRLVVGALGLSEPGDEDRWTDGQDRPVGVGVAEEQEQVTDEQAGVRAAWSRFLEHVSAPAVTRTPGELAAHAIEQDGLPADAVRTLRDAFRAVEYGGRPADVERVQTAVEAIETAREKESRSTPDKPVGGDD